MSFMINGPFKASIDWSGEMSEDKIEKKRTRATEKEEKKVIRRIGYLSGGIAP